MDLTFSYPPALLVLTLLGAGLLTAWSYRRNRPPLSNWKGGVLGALRGTSFAILLLLLFGAVWHRFSTTDEQALVALLIDTSESLTVEHNGKRPSEKVREALQTLPDDPRLRPYTFGSNASPSQEARWDSLTFDGERTDIAAALERIESDFEGRNLGAVLLLSDGRVTSGRNPLYLAGQYPVPIHTVVAGDSLSSNDVRVARVLTNEVAYAEAPVPIRVGITASGFEGRQTTVRVTENNATLGSTTVTLPRDEREVSRELTITPTEPGLHHYTITVAPLEGEATNRNNSETVAVRVLDQERRILLVAGAPSPDLTALRSALETNSTLVVTVRTQRGPGSFYEDDLPSPLSSFDLLILLGYPGSASSPANIERLASAVDAELPLLFWLSEQTDLSVLDEQFGDDLPTRPGNNAFTGVPAQLSVVPGAEQHPILDGISSDAWSRLPPLLTPRSPWNLYPGARPLLQSASNGSEAFAPLMAIRETNARRSAAFLGVESWRWQTLPENLAQFSSTYPTLVSNLVQWTTARRDRRPVRVRPDRTLFGDRERITFTGQAYTEELTPLDDARIALTIQSETGETEQTTMRPLGNGRYTAEIAPQPAGTYSFHAEATSDGSSLGSDSGSFGVGELTLEFRNPGADPSLMRQLAQRSGGQTVEAHRLGDLFTSLRQQGMLDSRERRSDTETPLIRLPILLALLIGLLTVEWVFRKRWGLR